MFCAGMDKAELSHDSCVLKRLALKKKKEEDRASQGSLFNRCKSLLLMKKD